MPKQKYSDEIELVTKATCLATVAPIANVGYLAVMQDITQIKLAEAQRLRTERVEKERIKRALNRHISLALLDDVLAETSMFSQSITSICLCPIRRFAQLN